MWRRSTTAGALALVGGVALVAGFLTPVTATAAPSISPRAYTYGNWAQVGAGFMSGPDDTTSQVYQLTWRGAFPDLDDTPGPIYAAGSFIKSGSNLMNRVAMFDDTTATWVKLPGDDTGIAPGIGLGGVSSGAPTPGVYGMVLGGDDSIYVGGQFTASDDTLNNVAKWNGSDWERMGNGLDDTGAGGVVQDMVIGNDFIGGDDLNYADDTVYALGGFVGTCATLTCSATGRGAVGIAQYSQQDDTWYPVGSGTMTGGYSPVLPQAYAGAYIDDTLYIGGSFSNVGGGAGEKNIAQWSAAAGAWLPVGAGILDSNQYSGVFSMAVHPVTKDLYVGGQFSQPVGGSTAMGSIVKWDYEDDTWYAVGTDLTAGNVDDISFSADGETMYIGNWASAPTIGGTFANGIAILTSTDLDDTTATTVNGAWTYVKSAGAIGVTGPSNATLNQTSTRAVLAQPSNKAMFGGNFTTAGAVSAGRVALFTPGPEPDPNVPATPPGAPRNVVAKGGWQTVTVSWDPPVDQGTYPITNYLAQATAVGAAPAGNVCITRLTDAKLTECTFTSLKPGVQYTFRVQGLNGGGWGQRSEPSNIATPYELKITGYGRKKLSFLRIPLGSEVSARGTSLGYPAGTRISVFIKEGDTGQWVEQRNSGLSTNASGNFSWKRKFSANKDRTPISVQFGIGDDRSNVVRIPPVR